MIKIRLKRDYGPYLEKEKGMLMAGEYTAEMDSWNNGYNRPGSFIVRRNGFIYLLQPCDVEVLNKTFEELKAIRNEWYMPKPVVQRIDFSLPEPKVTRHQF